MKAGVVVSADQGCPGVHHLVATLVGWLELMWARGPGLTEVAGEKGFQGEGDHNSCCFPVRLTQREFHQLLHCLAYL